MYGRLTPTDDRFLILVVDDDPVLRHLSSEILRRGGYRVEEAENGAVALRRFWEMAPALVLMDVRMPVLDGLTACAEIRKVSDFATTPVLMLTSLDDPESIDRAFNAGATDFIVKPVNPKLLVERVRFALRSRRMADDLQRSQAHVTLAQNLAGVVYWEYDPAKDLLHLSEDLGRLLGLPAGRHCIPAESIYDHVHPLDEPRLREFLARSVSSGEQVSVEFRFFHPDGSDRHLYTKSQVHKDANGKMPLMIGSLQDITELRNLEESHDFLLRYDSLTGLPNKALFLDRFRQSALHSGQDRSSVALIVAGIKNCNLVASSLGSDVCDALLKTVAERLAGTMVEADTVARLSYGNFGIILSHIGTPEKAAVAARKALSVMTQAVEVGGHQLFLDAGAGISMYPPDGSDEEAVFNNANTAFARAIEEGDGGFCFFKAEMNAKAHRRLNIETDLRRAVRDQEFFLHFQPQLSLRSSTVSGCEALLRWQSGPGGSVSPAEFVPILEETGLIKTVSPWVLREACFQLKKWQEEGLHIPSVSANLSARDFQDPDLPQVVRKVLGEAEIEPGMLELEITESVIMTDPDAALSSLKELKAMGVRLALDDFGTGYSSLAYLQRLPLDVLKIDRTFITDMSKNPENKAIVGSIIELSHGLGMEVVAEGVEDQDVLSMLRDMGCETGQGYYIGRPMAGDDVARWLEARLGKGIA